MEWPDSWCLELAYHIYLHGIVHTYAEEEFWIQTACAPCFTVWLQNIDTKQGTEDGN